MIASRGSAIALDRAELDGRAGEEDAYALVPQQCKQLRCLVIGDDEIHFNGHVRGEFEKVLFVQDSVAAESRDCANRRTAAYPKLLRLLEQPLEQRDVAVFPILVHVESQQRAVHGASLPAN